MVEVKMLNIGNAESILSPVFYTTLVKSKYKFELCGTDFAKALDCYTNKAYNTILLVTFPLDLIRYGLFFFYVHNYWRTGVKPQEMEFY